MTEDTMDTSICAKAHAFLEIDGWKKTIYQNENHFYEDFETFEKETLEYVAIVKQAFERVRKIQGLVSDVLDEDTIEEAHEVYRGDNTG